MGLPLVGNWIEICFVVRMRLYFPGRESLFYFIFYFWFPIMLEKVFFITYSGLL